MKVLIPFRLEMNLNLGYQNHLGRQSNGKDKNWPFVFACIEEVGIGSIVFEPSSSVSSQQEQG